MGEGGTGCGGDKEGPGLLTDDLRPEVKEICEGRKGGGRERRKVFLRMEQQVPRPKDPIGGLDRVGIG